MSEVVREVRMHSPGFIVGVAYQGEIPGNSIVRLDAENKIVEIAPMGAAPVVSEVVEAAPAVEAESSEVGLGG